MREPQTHYRTRGCGTPWVRGTVRSVPVNDTRATPKNDRIRWPPVHVMARTSRPMTVLGPCPRSGNSRALRYRAHGLQRLASVGAVAAPMGSADAGGTLSRAYAPVPGNLSLSAERARAREPIGGKPLPEGRPGGGRIVPVKRGAVRTRHFGKQAPDPIRLHRCVRVVQKPVKFIQFAAVFVARHSPPTTIARSRRAAGSSPCKDMRCQPARRADFPIKPTTSPRAQALPCRLPGVRGCGTATRPPARRRVRPGQTIPAAR